MEFEVGESLVEGVGSLHMNSHPVNVEFDACSTPGSTGRPPYHPSIKQLKHDWSSSGSHATPTDQKMKTVYSSSGSKIVSERSHKKSHLVMDNEGDSNSLHGRKDIVHRNEHVVDETGQDNPIKQNLTSESDFAIQQPVEDAETCNPGGVGLLNSSLLPDKGPVEILNTPLPSKLGMGCCPSPQNSFYSATQYMEAKQSFTSTEVSESTSSIRKSVESGEVSNSWDFSENKKACMYRGSTGSDISDESSSSSFSSAMYKPHQGLDIRWEAIQAVRSRNNGAALELKDFRIFKRLGGGDIGSVHLAELIGTRTCFALKVMDKEALVSRKKLLRAQTEKEILQCLDHPFLPSLYNHFETEKLSFLVMEFCPGGDLHVLRQKQPGKFFPEHAARFYVAEVLLALEYLHMLGIIYRDLKPENVLVREDGHIMLSDFDLSLRCTFSPTLVKSSNATSEPKNSGYCIGPSCVIQPNCIQPTCFGPRFLNKPKKEKKPRQKTEMYHHHQVTPLPELIAEPTNARSMSFVGTHEYLAPEIIKGEGHGSAVDWWMFGIFLYELLFGRTPFKGSGNRATLFNVVGQPLRFPEIPSVSFAARDLIRGLLVKEPQHRLAYRRGATEIKQHPFFQSVNWALIRCASPPDVPPPFVMHDVGSGKVQGGDVKAESGNYYEIEFF